MNLISRSHSNNSWIIKQKWSYVLFMHFKVNANELQRFVPYPLDKFDNQAFVSIVPFRMSHIQLRGLPSQLSRFYGLWELNLRTYVEVDGVSGIYFITLDASSLLGTLIANTVFKLPYRFAFLKQNNYSFSHHYNGNSSLELSYHVGDTLNKSDFDIWATERYSLFTYKNKNNYRGIVSHSPWPLREVKIDKFNDNFSRGLINRKFSIQDMYSPSYCKELDVSFMPFIKI